MGVGKDIETWAGLDSGAGGHNFLGEKTALPLNCSGHLQHDVKKLPVTGCSEMLEGTQVVSWVENAGAFEGKCEFERKFKRKLMPRFCETYDGCLCYRASREWRFQDNLDSLHNRT